LPIESVKIVVGNPVIVYFKIKCLAFFGQQAEQEVVTINFRIEIINHVILQVAHPCAGGD
jgi:hypothetical protein